MKNVAHFCSGGGTTMAYVAENANNGKLGDIRSGLVIVSKAGIGAITKAEEILKIPFVILKNAKDPDEILNLLRKHKIDIASLNGYLKQIPEKVIIEFEKQGGLFINQHPGILRADHIDFGGKGMYGLRVMATLIFYILHRGLEGNDVFTESTVQYVAPEYDKGQAVGIEKLYFGDKLAEFKNRMSIICSNNLKNIDYTDPTHPTVIAITKFTETIQALLLPLEHKNVANVLKRIGAGEKPLSVDPEYFVSLGLDESLLAQAKQDAFVLFPKG